MKILLAVLGTANLATILSCQLVRLGTTADMATRRRPTMGIENVEPSIAHLASILSVVLSTSSALGDQFQQPSQLFAQQDGGDGVVL